MADRAELDGLPVLLAPTRRPNVTAGLVFRVGQADETLASRGVTHLVEHLAMPEPGVADYHDNGAVDALTTQFVTHGSEQAVTAFLTEIADALTNLPLSRLETEKDVLRAEAQHRSAVNAMLPLWRYGAQGFGLPSYPEWGLSRLSGHDVAAWAHTHFCRGNAALWIVGDRIPPGLTLDLPEGARSALPTPTSTVPRFPAYFNGPGGGLVLDALVPRSVASSLFAAVLGRMLLRALRHDAGISYTVDTDYSPRGDDRATITVFADTTEDKHGLLIGTVGDALKRMRVAGVDADDLAAVQRRAIEALDHPDTAAARLPGMAINELTGYPNLSTEDFRAELADVTLDAVNAVAAQLLDTALLQVPHGHAGEPLGFHPAPTASTDSVTGTRYRPHGGGGSALIIGARGVTLTGDGTDATVYFDRCAARLDWPDGARCYVGLDGMAVSLEPTLHSVTAEDIAAVVDGLDGDRVIPMPARERGEIPTPSPVLPRTREQRRARIGRTEAVIMPLLTLGLLSWSIVHRVETVSFCAGMAAYFWTLFIFLRRRFRGYW